ncbi:transcriptional regulator with XRE-family HTH domain [Actinocorallia herbida]|uniref:Transcriptional regulator with XRE-family HTH domain n=1 Tax=Actinocorallia herbida TaxID=58109 RepID=A0A3N1D3M0_9ACTN|nr:helix-turn-helix transcriptional regulator [Actinocorallia herbida]ROO88100.1 transcriptional regulator with XRE-family HTH domain [Actinocorallia herbida]
MSGEQMTMGQRIARARRRKNWDQETFAAAINRSPSWVSKVENGRLPLDRQSVIARVAEALGVEVGELTGQPYRHETAELDSGHASVPGLRLALQQATMPGGAALIGPREPAPLDDLSERLKSAEALRQDARFTALGDVLPGIITDLVLHTSDRTSSRRDEAEGLMLRACHMARVTANLLGHHDLGWTAVQRELLAAQHVGSPELVAAAAWDLCGVWLHEASLEPARDVALAAIDQLETHLTDDTPDLLALWGALHLRAAVAHSRLWRKTDAETHLDEAVQAARRLPAYGNVFQTQFNLVNTAIHAVEISLELGRPRDVTNRSELVAIGDIDSRERQAHYWTCTAAGLAMNNKEDKAVDALLQADRTAPQHVRNRPLVRNLVRDLLTSPSHTRHRDVRALATKMSLDT